MAKIAKPWIAFKILAAGAIQPLAAFPYAFTHGADFILVGMFDWQVAEDAALARRVIRLSSKPTSKRTRPWYGGRWRFKAPRISANVPADTRHPAGAMGHMWHG